MNRRGSVYVLVLGIAVAAFVIAGGAMAVAQAQAKIAKDQNDSLQAQALAWSAIDAGRALIASDPDWRSNRSNGSWFSNRTVGNGSMSLDVVNPNGALNNSIFDPIHLTGIGSAGRAQHRTRVTLQPQPQPYTCLNNVIHAHQSLLISSATLGIGGIISSNSTLSATNSVISGAVEAVGSITGGNYLDRTTTAIVPKTMPGGDVFDWYISTGATVNFAMIPAPSGIRTIDRRLFSPSHNPFGSTNAQGIYVLNCSGNRIIIQNTRILGTLLILNPGANSIIQGAMVCHPAIANYPTIMVQGSITISTGGTLAESGTNFNPAGAPFEGVTDSDTTDSYASILYGLTFVSGSLTINSTPVFQGVVVSVGSMTLGGSITATYLSTFSNNPPPGFGLPPKMIPSPGTWQQTVN